MNSRDRLADGPLKQGIEEELAEVLRHHEKLRELKNRRREKEIAERLEDSTPLEDVLKSLIRRSPTLASLFLLGKKLPNPFTPESVKGEDKAYEGKRFPEYFRFKGKPYGTVLERNTHIDRRARLLFETDATNDYLDREVDPGSATLEICREGGREAVGTFSLNLHDGVGALTVPLPPSATPGDVLSFRLEVTDDSRIDGLVNEFRLRVKPKAAPLKNKPGGKKKPRSKNKGGDRDAPVHLALPEIVPVHEAEWEEHKFDRFSALKITHAGSTNDNGEAGAEAYDFYVNVDNIYLRTEQKRSKEPAELMQQRFMHALVLLGLAMIHDDMSSRPTGDDDEKHESSLESKVAVITRAVAPVLLPMIDALGSIEEA